MICINVLHNGERVTAKVGQGADGTMIGTRVTGTWMIGMKEDQAIRIGAMQKKEDWETIDQVVEMKAEDGEVEEDKEEKEKRGILEA